MNNPSLSLDWHESRLLYVTLAILFLCFADAHNTLQLLWDGARETNFLMDVLVRKSAILFMTVKLGLTAVCMVILVSYHHVTLFNLIRIRHVIYSIFGMYMVLISYELAIWPRTGASFFLISAEGSHGTVISTLLSLL